MITLRFKLKVQHLIKEFKRRVLYRRLNKNYRELAQYFQNKRIALIGNSNLFPVSYYGDLIDNHDVIIRMNLATPFALITEIDKTVSPWLEEYSFSNSKSLQNDQMFFVKKDAPEEILDKYTHVNVWGRKTSVWSCANTDRERQRLYSKVFSDAEVFLWTYPYIYFADTEILPKISRVPSEMYISLYDQLKPFVPSTGLVIFYYLLKINNFKELNVFRFDFFRNDSHIVRRSSLKKTFHNGEAEETMMLQFLSERKNVFLHECRFGQ